MEDTTTKVQKLQESENIFSGDVTEPEDRSDTPLCSCGEPTCLGQCGIDPAVYVDHTTDDELPFAETETTGPRTGDEGDPLDEAVSRLGSNKRDAYDALVAGGYLPTEALQMVEEYCTDEKEPFRVHDMSSANWVLKQIAMCDETEAEVIQMMNDEIASITRRIERILKPITQKRTFFEKAYGPQLEEWTRENLQGQKKKSIPLIYGTCGTKKATDKLEIVDEARLVDTLRTLGHADLVKVTKLDLSGPTWDIKDFLNLLDSCKSRGIVDVELAVKLGEFKKRYPQIVIDCEEQIGDDSRIKDLVKEIPGTDEFYFKATIPEAGNGTGN
jgi:hypothetical protein